MNEATDPIGISVKHLEREESVQRKFNQFEHII